MDHEINSQLISWEINLPDPSREDSRSFTLEYKYDVEGILHVKAEDDLTGNILLEETVSFGASGDRKKMVKIAKEVSNTMATGSIDNSLSRSSLDPEIIKLLDQVDLKHHRRYQQPVHVPAGILKQYATRLWSIPIMSSLYE